MDQSPELLEDDIKKQCAEDLSVLCNCGDVAWYSRLQSGHVETKYGSHVQLCAKGTSDFIAVVKNKSRNLSVLFIEVKNSSGGKWSDEQQLFASKVSVHQDIHYILLSDTETLKQQILAIAFDRVDDMKGPGDYEPDF